MLGHSPISGAPLSSLAGQSGPTYIGPVAGGATLGGAAVTAWTKVRTTSGGLTLGGTAPKEYHKPVRIAPAPTGGLVFGGVPWTYKATDKGVCTPIGGFRLFGHSPSYKTGIVSFVSIGAFASGTGALTVANPASGQSNDLELLYVESANEAITNPGGAWAEATSSPISTGTAAAAGGVRLGVYWRWWVDNTSTVTVADTGNHTTARRMYVRYVDTTTPFDVTPVTAVQAAGTSWSMPDITPTSDNTMIVLGIGNDQDAATTNTALSAWANSNLFGLTERADDTVTSGVGGGVGIATGNKIIAGAIGNTTLTSSASVVAVYHVSALRHAPVAMVKGEWIPTKGLTFAGAATTIKPEVHVVVGEYTGTGGMSLSGAGVIVNTFVSPQPVGGLSISGAATINCTWVMPDSTGGVLLSGSAGVGRTYSVIPSGGMVLSGSVVGVKTFVVPISGGATLSGIGYPQFFEGSNLAYSWMPSGGMAFGGAGFTLNWKLPVPSGGLYLGGTAVIGHTYVAPTTVGVLVLAGTAPVENTFVAPDASGGMVVLGSALVSWGKSYVATGGVVLSGSGETCWTRVVTASGGLIIGGAADTHFPIHLAPQPIGGVTLSGEAVTQVLRAFIYYPAGGGVVAGTAPVHRVKVFIPTGGLSLKGHGYSYKNDPRYWVGGSGTWDAITTTHWSATSGGAGGASVPDSTKDVIFDASSGTGTYTITVSNNIWCRSFINTGFAGILDCLTYYVTIYVAGPLFLLSSAGGADYTKGYWAIGNGEALVPRLVTTNAKQLWRLTFNNDIESRRISITDTTLNVDLLYFAPVGITTHDNLNGMTFNCSDTFQQTAASATTYDMRGAVVNAKNAYFAWSGLFYTIDSNTIVHLDKGAGTHSQFQGGSNNQKLNIEVTFVKEINLTAQTNIRKLTKASGTSGFVRTYGGSSDQMLTVDDLSIDGTSNSDRTTICDINNNTAVLMTASGGHPIQVNWMDLDDTWVFPYNPNTSWYASNTTHTANQTGWTFLTALGVKTAPTPSGYIYTGGSAANCKTRVWVSSGGMQLGGVAPLESKTDGITRRVYQFVSGGAVLGGSSETRPYPFRREYGFVSGGAQFSGSALLNKWFLPLPTGGLSLGGSAALQRNSCFSFQAPYPYSGLVFAGAAVTRVSWLVDYFPTGGVSYGGTAPKVKPTHSHAFAPSSTGLRFPGNPAPTSLHTKIRGTVSGVRGGLHLAGHAYSRTNPFVRFIPTMGMNVGGTAATGRTVVRDSLCAINFTGRGVCTRFRPVEEGVLSYSPNSALNAQFNKIYTTTGRVEPIVVQL